MGRIAIVGAGLVGRSWAVVFARAGHAVALHDPGPGVPEVALGRIDRALDELASAGLLGEEPGAVRARIAVADDLADALAGADLAQESAYERVEVKRSVFAAMDALAPPTAILASSTSSIPASRFTGELPGRARCLVAHPVNPPHLVPLVELSPAPWTDAAVVDRARALYAAAGQVPITVRSEIEGFILNRLQGAVLGEALRLYEDGYVSADDLDATLRDGLGLRWSFMGPFETIDLNAPGGLADYATRYRGLYEAIGSTQLPRPWADAAIARLDAERRAALPAERLAERAAWRDRRLVALAAHRRAMAAQDATRTAAAAQDATRTAAAAAQVDER